MTIYRKPTGYDSPELVTWRPVVPVEPDAWGITSWRQLYDCMAVAENGGDWKECTDALGAALGIQCEEPLTLEDLYEMWPAETPFLKRLRAEAGIGEDSTPEANVAAVVTGFASVDAVNAFLGSEDLKAMGEDSTP